MIQASWQLLNTQAWQLDQIVSSAEDVHDEWNNQYHHWTWMSLIINTQIHTIPRRNYTKFVVTLEVPCMYYLSNSISKQLRMQWMLGNEDKGRKMLVVLCLSSMHPVVIKYTKVVAEARIYLVPPRSGRMPHLLCTKLLKFILNKIFVS